MQFLFVVSAPRSGSTLLRTVLDRHPAVALTHEAGWLDWLVRSRRLAQIPCGTTWDDGEGNRIDAPLSAASADAVLGAFRDNLPVLIDALTRRLVLDPGVRYFGDKIHGVELLEFATEPTIVDFPHESPDEAGPGVWACPLNFDPPADLSLTDQLLAEVARLRPWALETRRERGRSLFGASGATQDHVDDVARALGHVAEHGDVHRMPPTGASDEGIEWRFKMPLLIRHLADDLRTFYHEALAGQPGPGAPNHHALNEWIFGGTALGKVFLAVADHLTDADDGMAKLVRGLLIPEGHYQGGSAFPKTKAFGADEDEDEDPAV